MGSESSVNVSSEQLASCRIGSVRSQFPDHGEVLTLYYREGNDVFLLPAGEHTTKTSAANDRKCRSVFKVEHIVGANATEELSADNTATLYKLTIMYYNPSQDDFELRDYYFQDGDEFHHAKKRFQTLNLTRSHGIDRKLWVFVNPISGKGLSKEYYANILQPVLEFTGISHCNFETNSSNYIEKFLENLNNDKENYTDFVIIGGDGVFNQLLNAMMNHKDCEKLLKLSIGFMPGGSSNALSWDLGSKNPHVAAIQIVRGAVVKGDMFRITLHDHKKSIYSTAFTYGFPTDLIRESETLRGIFGRYRYLAVGVKQFLCHWSLPNYDSEVYYKEADASQDSDASTEFAEILQAKQQDYHINLPRVLKVQSKASKEWRKLSENRFLFYAIVTHEVKSSINKEVFAPFARVNDGKMYIVGVKNVGKIGGLRYLFNVSNGTHLDYERFFFIAVSELKIKNPEGSYFWVDGEPHESSDYSVKLFPGCLNFIGTVENTKIKMLRSHI